LFGAKAPDSTKVKAEEREPVPPSTLLLKQGYFSIDSKEDGEVDLNVSDSQCPKNTYPAFFYGFRDSHLNEEGFTMGLYSHMELVEDGDGYKIKGEAFEIDDSSERPHDWIGVVWQIWCSSNSDVVAPDSILSDREHEP
jgi:hypothetical protein